MHVAHGKPTLSRSDCFRPIVVPALRITQIVQELTLIFNIFQKSVHYYLQIYVSTNPKGAERLPPGIVVPETDLYPRKSWGEHSEVGGFFCCNP